ncbi:hypothetical protein AURDEDRAFT_177067 [Auricularia subglabra TFB-10046 SS5]|uniref:Uncharacterized protein n=1 Tax=Auricularia subglabra (strain TFB-10046 / SS5) TaxID=717982 RepID=J0WNB5_AURST|nr:hypothetical protein AURDEDRAFT_177067 [Auricularia subglabra TFB-10046 SS5]
MSDRFAGTGSNYAETSHVKQSDNTVDFLGLARAALAVKRARQPRTSDDDIQMVSDPGLHLVSTGYKAQAKSCLDDNPRGPGVLEAGDGPSTRKLPALLGLVEDIFARIPSMDDTSAMELWMRDLGDLKDIVELDEYRKMRSHGGVCSMEDIEDALANITVTMDGLRGDIDNLLQHSHPSEEPVSVPPQLLPQGRDPDQVELMVRLQPRAT